MHLKTSGVGSKLRAILQALCADAEIGRLINSKLTTAAVRKYSVSRFTLAIEPTFCECLIMVGVSRVTARAAQLVLRKSRINNHESSHVIAYPRQRQSQLIDAAVVLSPRYSIVQVIPARIELAAAVLFPMETLVSLG